MHSQVSVYSTIEAHGKYFSPKIFQLKAFSHQRKFDSLLMQLNTLSTVYKWVVCTTACYNRLIENGVIS